MSSKPTVIFVPGAWHTPESFERVAALLTSAGYGYEGVHLKTSTADGPYIQSNDPDVEAIQSAITQATDAEKEVVMVMHSYGGIPGSSACKGLSKQERAAEGKPGGVTALVYLAAFAVDEGTSIATVLGRDLAPWIKIHAMDTYATAQNSNHVFYNDLSDEEASKWTSKLNKQATKAFWSPVTYAAWKHIPSTYVVCCIDNAIPEAAQVGMASQGGKFKIEKLEATSHSPFLSKPKETAELIKKAAGEAF